MRLPHAIAVAAATAAITAVATSAVLAATSDQGPETRLAPREKPTPVKTVPARVTQSVAAFRRPQRATDRLPGDPVADLNALGDWQPGENPALSRGVALGDGRRGYLWPKADGVCFSSPGPAGCVSVDAVQQLGVALSTASATDDPTVRVFGVVREGIASVTLSLADGSQVAAPVVDGSVYFEVQSRPTTASWRDADGSAGTADVPMPPP